MIPRIVARPGSEDEVQRLERELLQLEEEAVDELSSRQEKVTKSNHVHTEDISELRAMKRETLLAFNSAHDSMVVQLRAALDLAEKECALLGVTADLTRGVDKL